MGDQHECAPVPRVHPHAVPAHWRKCRGDQTVVPEADLIHRVEAICCVGSAEAGLILGDPLDGVGEHVVNSVRDGQRRRFVGSERVAHKETRHPAVRDIHAKEGGDEVLDELQIERPPRGKHMETMPNDDELLLGRELGAVIMAHQRMPTSACVNVTTEPVRDGGSGRSAWDSGQLTDAHR